MTGLKTNERPGTKARVRYVRMSASKVRVVLNLVRGKSVSDANQILAFSQRLAAKEISNALDAAVANAQHNDEQTADELYVSACFADEGPTLKRFRPRARGRAGRINKQTCHITIIVSRMDDETLDLMREKAASRSGAKSSSANRRARVAKSRGEEVDEAAADEEAVDEAAIDEDLVAEDVADAEADLVTDDTTETEDDAADGEADVVADDPIDAAATEDDAAEDTVAGDAVATDTADAAEGAAPYGAGSHGLIGDDPEAMPEGFPVKGNDQSKLYHNEDSPFYDRTKAEVWFASDEVAEAAGFAKPESQQKREAEDTEAGDV